MDLKIVFDTYQELKTDNLSLVYQGNFSDDVTAKILHLSENNIDNVKELSKLKRKVSFILVECFQNIVRHREQVDNRDDSLSGLFLTRNIGKDYFITSANLIERSSISDLKEKLGKINSLNKDDLRDLYLNTLENDGFSERGGAGLGLIEMARKSGNKLEYDFEDLDEKYAYFYLRIRISKENAEELSPEEKAQLDQQVPLNLAKGFRSDMSDNNILMIYKGDFSQGAILPVLKMIEDNLMHQKEAEAKQKRIYWVLVEVLQNISKHALEGQSKEGIFMLGRDKDSYSLYTGNLMSVESVPSFKKHLEMVNGLNSEELTKLYKATLREGKGTSRGGAGLGIIDIVRESGNKLQYQFIDLDEKSVFFSINIRI